MRFLLFQHDLVEQLQGVIEAIFFLGTAEHTDEQLLAFETEGRQQAAAGIRGLAGFQAYGVGAVAAAAKTAPLSADAVTVGAKKKP